ncbi:MAG: ZIP family metal transporter, partial [Rhodovibrionaceae bacterium]
IKRLWLFVLAITLHNFPEGLAVGVGAVQEDTGKGLALTLGILAQNIPEGLIAAIALYALGYGLWPAFGLSALTGLVEPIGGLLGAAAVGLSAALLPWALAVSAGAMITVVGGEMIPETHRAGHENRATAALIVGFAAMLLLDSGLG